MAEQCMMTWSMVITIIGSNIALAGIFAGFVYWAFSKLDADIRSVSIKIDADMTAQTNRTDQLHKRTDQLYQMFIDLLKEQKPKTHP